MSAYLKKRFRSKYELIEYIKNIYRNEHQHYEQYHTFM